MYGSGQRAGWDNSFVQLELFRVRPMSSFFKWKKCKPRGMCSSRLDVFYCVVPGTNPGHD